MYATPKRCLFIYGRGLSRPAIIQQSQLNVVNEAAHTTLLEQTTHTGLDSVVKQGTAGTLVFPGQDNIECSIVNELRLLFGITKEATTESQIRADYKKMFHKLRVALFTDSLEACQFGDRLGLSTTHLISSDLINSDNNTDSVNQVQNNIISILASTSNDVADLCLVYWTASSQVSNSAFNNNICWMDTLCARVLDDNTLSKEVLVTLVASPFNKVSFDAMRKLRAIYQSLDTSSAAYTQQLNLKPSYSIWDNTLISQFYSNRGIYAIFHTDSTRCDDAVVFSEHNCAAKGTSGCVLTCQLMAEVAFKLGRTPKYGA